MQIRVKFYYFNAPMRQCKLCLLIVDISSNSNGIALKSKLLGVRYDNHLLKLSIDKSSCHVLEIKNQQEVLSMLYFIILSF